MAEGSSSRNQFFSKARSVYRGAKRAVIAGFFLSVGTAMYQRYKTWQDFITLPPAFFLELDLEQNVLVEQASNNPITLLTSRLQQLELHTLIQALHTAKADDRVRGLMTVLGDRQNFAGIAQLQELRNALLDFRFHVKGRAPIYAYSNTFGEGGMNATGLYYLASAADKVYMPPTSCLSLLGFESTQVFVRGLLDKLKVQPEVFRREEYKAAMATFTETAFDPAHRENLTSLLQSMYDQVVSGIASARRLSPEAVEQAISAAPLLPAMATNMGLLDGLMYRDQVEQLLQQQLPADVQQQLQKTRNKLLALPPTPMQQLSLQLTGPRVSLQRYSIATEWAKQRAQFWGGKTATTPSGSSSSGSGSSSNSSPAQDSTNSDGPVDPTAAADGSASSVQQNAAVAAATAAEREALGAVRAVQQLPQLSKPAVAVVTAVGPIVQSAGPGGAGATGDGIVESHKLVRQLRALRENPQVKAVVLRINSPGGSAVASDMIAREVALLRDAGKPVVACMGDVAASGGYYIAASANKILAQPGTITGSIGVIFAKFKVKEALEEAGITGDTIKLGDNADWASPFHTLTPKQQQQVDSLMDATYNNFLLVVARGRNMSAEAVREVAKGRVWSGSQAVQVGLVDELGGVRRALELAKQLAGLPEDPAATQTVEWPPRRTSPLIRLLKSAGAAPGPENPPLAALAAAPAAVAGTAARLSAAASAAAEMLGLVAENYWRVGLDNVFACAAGSSSSYEQQLVQAAAAAAGMQPPGVRPQAAAMAAAATTGGSPAAALAGLLIVQQYRSMNPTPAPELVCWEAPLLAYSC